MAEKTAIISPIDDSIVAERTLAGDKEIHAAVKAAAVAQEAWRRVSIAYRAVLCHRAIDALVVDTDAISEEITRQMGRPIRSTPGELRVLEDRARYMIDIAENATAEIVVADQPGFTRFIRREPVGVALTIAPWNYPYLTAVNSVIPAIMAGNAVILKHSAQTLLCAERFAQAFARAGLPTGVFQILHLSHAATVKLVKNDAINFISFTGSVAGGDAMEHAAAGLFKGLALELGGNDPAYVRHDADLENILVDLVDGAFFNSGQSCCAVERIYVDKKIYASFVEQFLHSVNQYRLGNPLDPDTTLGPMVHRAAAASVRAKIEQALSRGAKAGLDSKRFDADQQGTPYLAPQVLLNVDHSMAVMQEESFGPVVGIMQVDGDHEAVELMNDSPYGLTASIWTRDETRARKLGDQLRTGTVFMNRCDYLDPALAWVGVKKSGRGCALSALGYQQLTRPKSFHLKHSSP
ncbi:MAG: aldehyde dehydrogenase family protein [Gammaproteobacteria bacterium]